MKDLKKGIERLIGIYNGEVAFYTELFEETRNKYFEGKIDACLRILSDLCNLIKEGE